ncbi:MAG: hypothetical protein HeimC3_06020 [Candidatus Heimdallarchaeota archaeon LC_3]|nr:MAG: hypothetical protein HeimC3_06020 [Candidatus Heimdallarchaeota archaeon LC_3]
MIINRQKSLNFFRKDQVIRGSTHFAIIILIWIWIWVIEVILFRFGFLKISPVLVIPTSFSLNVLLSYLMKFVIILIYFNKINHNVNLSNKLPLKLITKKYYCLIPSLDLVAFGFECQLPTTDQIKNIESINDFAPFTIEITWETGICKIIFYRSRMEKSNSEYVQIFHFLEKSFNNTKLLSSMILKDLFQLSLVKKIQNQKKMEYISKNEEFSEIIRSIKSNNEFLYENRQNEEFNYNIEIQSIIYWQFSKEFLIKICKTLRFSQNLLEDFSLGKIIYNLSTSVDSENLNNTNITNFPSLGLPPLKWIRENEKQQNTQLLLYIFNKWMFRKFFPGSNNIAEKNDSKPKIISNIKSKNEINLQIPKNDQLLKKKDLDHNKSKKRKKSNEINNVEPYELRKRQKLIKLIENQPEIVSKKNKNKLKDYVKDVKSKTLDNDYIKKYNDISPDLEEIKTNSNFKAALDIFNTNTPSNVNMEIKLSEQNDFLNWKFTDFCKNFCSKFQEMSKILSYPNGVCLDFIAQNNEIRRTLISKVKNIDSDQRLFILLTSTVKAEKLNRDRTSCLFNSLQNLPDEEKLLTSEVKYLVFKEIFL